jgi:3-isopropylmalate/(R)-2-methylmalate dehydratase small subunit
MNPVERIVGPATLLDIKDINTDVILPARYLKVLTRSGLGVAAFYTHRFAADGTPLATDPFRRADGAVAPILITGENFGCGSSREHASWALLDFGVRAVISPRFADIFAGNAFKNGLLLIELPRSQIEQLIAAGTEQLTVDLSAQTVTAAGGASVGFDIDAFRKTCLLGGLDEIALTEKHAADISRFEAQHEKRFPWLTHTQATPPP